MTAFASILLLAAAPVTFDAARHSVTLTAVSTDCGVDTQAEFLLVGPNTDHDYESMFVTEASVTDIAKAFAAAGIPLGRNVDFTSCRFWPVGEELTMEPAFTNFVREMRGDTTPSVLYTGGLRDAKGVPEAETNMPSAVFALYGCAQSLLQFNDALDQSATYGRFQPAVKIPKGEKRTFTFTWNGNPTHESVSLKVAPGKAAEAFTGLKDKAEKRQLDVIVDFAPEMTVKEAMAAANALALIDSPRVKINGAAEGQLFYRAYLPLEKWRDRKERLAQPPEVHLKGDGTFVVTRIVEDWKSDPESTDPRLVVSDHPCKDVAEAAKLLDEYCGNTVTILVFAGETTPVSRIYELKKAVTCTVYNWYVFTE